MGQIRGCFRFSLTVFSPPCERPSVLPQIPDGGCGGIFVLWIRPQGKSKDSRSQCSLPVFLSDEGNLLTLCCYVRGACGQVEKSGTTFHSGLKTRAAKSQKIQQIIIQVCSFLFVTSANPVPPVSQWSGNRFVHLRALQPPPSKNTKYGGTQAFSPHLNTERNELLIEELCANIQC